jgi:hypothetical protein
MGAEPVSGSIGRYKIVRRIEGQSRELYHARERDDVRQRSVVLAVFEMRAEDAKLLTEEVERWASTCWSTRASLACRSPG